MYIQNEFNDLSNWALQSNVGGYSGSEKSVFMKKSTIHSGHFDGKIA